MKLRNLLSTHKRLTAVLAVVLLAGGVLADLGFSLLTASDMSLPFGTTTNHSFYPVEVTVETDGSRDATGMSVARYSPRGNVSAVRIHDYPTDEVTIWRESHAVFEQILIVPDPSLSDHVERIDVRIGPQRASFTWEDLAGWDTESVEGDGFGSDTAYVVPTDEFGLPRGSLVGAMSTSVNYRGDVRAGLWAVIRVGLAAGVFGGLFFIFFGFRWSQVVRLAPRSGSGERPAFDELHGRLASAVAVLGAVAVMSVYMLTPGVLWSLPQLAVDMASAVNPAATLGFTLGVILLVVQARHTDAVRPAPGIRKRFAFDKRLFVTFLLVFTLLLRVWALDFMQATDNFALTAGRAITDTGSAAYSRNIHLSHLVAWLFGWFGPSVEVARMPFIILNVLTLLPILVLARPLGRTVAIVSGLLFALSPVAIEKAAHIREYNENLLFAVCMLALLTWVWTRLRRRPIYFMVVAGVLAGVSALSVFFYSELTDNRTILSVLQLVAFFAVLLSVCNALKELPEYRKLWWGLLAGFFVLVWLLSPHFAPFGYTLNPQSVFVEMYMNPFASDIAQWYSFNRIPMIAIALVLVAPWFVAKWRGSPLYRALFATFLFTVLLFALFMDRRGRSRYVYHLHAVFIVLFAVGLTTVLGALLRTGTVRLTKGVTLACTVLLLVSPLNAGLAAVRTQSRYYGVQQMTVRGTDNRVADVHDFLVESGIDRSDPIILDAHRPDIFSWYLDRPVTRAYDGESYDIAEGLYFSGGLGTEAELEKGLEAIGQTGRGFYVTTDEGEPVSEIQRDGVVFEYLATVRNHRVYRHEAEVQ